jgi:hypothetical protein
VVIDIINIDSAIFPGNPPIITTPYVTTKTTTETTDGTLQTTTGYTVSPEGKYQNTYNVSTEGKYQNTYNVSTEGKDQNTYYIQYQQRVNIKIHL